MYEAGMFADLQWNKIEEHHLEKWAVLRTKYRIGPKEPSSECAGLDDIANRCIDQCSDLLFDYIHTFEEQEAFSPEDKRHLMEDAIQPDELYGRLKRTLCDHLIVTFAHEFYCDNIPPQTPEEAFEAHVRMLFEHTEYYSPSGKWDVRESASSKSNRYSEFKKDLKKQYNSYREAVINAMDAAGSAIDAAEKERVIEGMHLPANWLFSLCMASNLQGFPYRYIDDDFPFVTKRKGTSNILSRLVKYLNNTKYLSLLINEEREIDKTQIWSPTIQYAKHPTTDFLQLRRKEGLKFVALAAEPHYSVKGKLNELKYWVNEDFEITIHPAVQIAMNNYLLELKFHGLALATAVQILQAEKEIRTEIILAPMRLKAPLVHAPFIHLLADRLISQPQMPLSLFKINRIISHWNAVALPVLEELFIWNVFKEYRNRGIGGAFHAIEESFLTKEYEQSRCDRLNIYRVVLPGKDGVVEVSKEMSTDGDRFYNRIYNVAVINSLGFEYDLKNEKFVREDFSQRVFDDLWG